MNTSLVEICQFLCQSVAQKVESIGLAIDRSWVQILLGAKAA